ncbi:hypothetical protein C7M84_022631, partial [Penaeus vannamei]
MSRMVCPSSEVHQKFTFLTQAESAVCPTDQPASIQPVSVPLWKAQCSRLVDHLLGFLFRVYSAPSRAHRPPPGRPPRAHRPPPGRPPSGHRPPPVASPSSSGSQDRPSWAFLLFGFTDRLSPGRPPRFIHDASWSCSQVFLHLLGRPPFLLTQNRLLGVLSSGSTANRFSWASPPVRAPQDRLLGVLPRAHSHRLASWASSWGSQTASWASFPPVGSQTPPGASSSGLTDRASPRCSVPPPLSHQTASRGVLPRAHRPPLSGVLLALTSYRLSLGRPPLAHRQQLPPRRPPRGPTDRLLGVPSSGLTGPPSWASLLRAALLTRPPLARLLGLQTASSGLHRPLLGSFPSPARAHRHRLSGVLLGLTDRLLGVLLGLTDRLLGVLLGPVQTASWAPPRGPQTASWDVLTDRLPGAPRTHRRLLGLTDHRLPHRPPPGRPSRAHRPLSGRPPRAHRPPPGRPPRAHRRLLRAFLLGLNRPPPGRPPGAHRTASWASSSGSTDRLLTELPERIERGVHQQQATKDTKGPYPGAIAPPWETLTDTSLTGASSSGSQTALLGVPLGAHRPTSGPFLLGPQDRLLGPGALLGATSQTASWGSTDTPGASLLGGLFTGPPHWASSRPHSTASLGVPSYGLTRDRPLASSFGAHRTASWCVPILGPIRPPLLGRHPPRALHRPPPWAVINLGIKQTASWAATRPSWGLHRPPPLGVPPRAHRTAILGRGPPAGAQTAPERRVLLGASQNCHDWAVPPRAHRPPPCASSSGSDRPGARRVPSSSGSQTASWRPPRAHRPPPGRPPRVTDASWASSSALTDRPPGATQTPPGPSSWGSQTAFPGRPPRAHNRLLGVLLGSQTASWASSSGFTDRHLGRPLLWAQTASWASSWGSQTDLLGSSSGGSQTASWLLLGTDRLLGVLLGLTDRLLGVLLGLTDRLLGLTDHLLGVLLGLTQTDRLLGRPPRAHRPPPGRPPRVTDRLLARTASCVLLGAHRPPPGSSLTPGRLLGLTDRLLGLTPVLLGSQSASWASSSGSQTASWAVLLGPSQTASWASSSAHRPPPGSSRAHRPLLGVLLGLTDRLLGASLGASSVLLGLTDRLLGVLLTGGLTDRLLGVLLGSQTAQTASWASSSGSQTASWASSSGSQTASWASQTASWAFSWGSQTASWASSWGSTDRLLGPLGLTEPPPGVLLLTDPSWAPLGSQTASWASSWGSQTASWASSSGSQTASFPLGAPPRAHRPPPGRPPLGSQTRLLGSSSGSQPLPDLTDRLLGVLLWAPTTGLPWAQDPSSGSQTASWAAPPGLTDRLWASSFGLTDRLPGRPPRAHRPPPGRTDASWASSDRLLGLTDRLLGVLLGLTDRLLGTAPPAFSSGLTDRLLGVLLGSQTASWASSSGSQTPPDVLPGHRLGLTDHLLGFLLGLTDRLLGVLLLTDPLGVLLGAHRPPLGSFLGLTDLLLGLTDRLLGVLLGLTDRLLGVLLSQTASCVLLGLTDRLLGVSPRGSQTASWALLQTASWAHRPPPGRPRAHRPPPGRTSWGSQTTSWASSWGSQTASWASSSGSQTASWRSSSGHRLTTGRPPRAHRPLLGLTDRLLGAPDRPPGAHRPPPGRPPPGAHKTLLGLTDRLLGLITASWGSPDRLLGVLLGLTETALLGLTDRLLGVLLGLTDRLLG